MLAFNYPNNIRNLIFQGFLTLKVQVGSSSLVLKTLNEWEYRQIGSLSGINLEGIDGYNPAEREILIQRWVPWALAWSTFLVDDANVFVERKSYNWHRDLLDFFRSFYREHLVVLSDVLGVLAAWYRFEIVHVKRFSIDPFSRMAWTSYKNLELNDPRVTMVPGTDMIGLNTHQLRYKAEMSGWERKLQWETDFDIAKFTTAAFSSKFARRAEERDRQRRKSEREDELELLERGPLEVSPLQRTAELDEIVRKTLHEGELDDHALAVSDYDVETKKEYFLERLAAELYILMYSQRRRLRDISIIGKVETIDLPIGQFDMEVAKRRAKLCLEELNFLGNIATKLSYSDSELEEVILEAAEMAKLHREKLLNERKSEDIQF